jgi:CheY-like chemotaxis protein
MPVDICAYSVQKTGATWEGFRSCAWNSPSGGPARRRRIRGICCGHIVTLPIGLAPAPAESVLRVPSSAPAAVETLAGVVRLDGLHILIADDDGDALALAEAILTGAGAEVRTCVSASAALDVLRQWRPDVLVSDIEMPGEDGYSLIRRVRGLPPDEGGETPAIALTAYGRPQDRLRSLAGGFNMHEPKPVDPGELTAIIASVAGQPERPRAS